MYEYILPSDTVHSSLFLNLIRQVQPVVLRHHVSQNGCNCGLPCSQTTFYPSIRRLGNPWKISNISAAVTVAC